MRGQHYRARDKTVRKMNRDGLAEENLRSGEAVRVSRREADHPALPGTADDSMNFQERRIRRTEGRKAGGRQGADIRRILKGRIVEKMAVHRPDCTGQTGRRQIPVEGILYRQGLMGKMCRQPVRIREICRRQTTG